MTHGHELKGGMLVGGGTEQRGIMGRKQWDICSSIINKGITGTTIKDTWTKSWGRVEVGGGRGFGWVGVEGWGEKPHNCN